MRRYEIASVRPGGQYRLVLEIPPLPDSTILLVEVGSAAHGTGLPGGEDHDELGVVVETPAQVLGLGQPGMRSVMQRTQPEGSRSGPGDTDRTLHPLRRFIHLAASGNPSILMSYWAPVIYETAAGAELRRLGDALGVRGGGHGVRGGGAPGPNWWLNTATTPSTPCIAPGWDFKAWNYWRPDSFSCRSPASRPSGCAPSGEGR